MVDNTSILDATAELRMVSMQLVVEQTRRPPDVEKLEQLDERVQDLGKRVDSLNTDGSEQQSSTRGQNRDEAVTVDLPAGFNKGTTPDQSQIFTAQAAVDIQA